MAVWPIETTRTGIETKHVHTLMHELWQKLLCVLLRQHMDHGNDGVWLTMNGLENSLGRQTSNLDDKNSRQKWHTEPDDTDDATDDGSEYDDMDDATSDDSDGDWEDIADSSEEEDGEWDDTSEIPGSETK